MRNLLGGGASGPFIPQAAGLRGSLREERLPHPAADRLSARRSEQVHDHGALAGAGRARHLRHDPPDALECRRQIELPGARLAHEAGSQAGRQPGRVELA